jgi:hypothetical protein
VLRLTSSCSPSVTPPRADKAIGIIYVRAFYLDSACQAKSDSKRTATPVYDTTAGLLGVLLEPHILVLSILLEKHTSEAMADLSAENAHPGSTTVSALNSKDNSRATTPSSATAEKAPEEGSKFKTLLSILRK